MDFSQGLKKGELLLHDTYRIEKVLGQGGFGITYLATDINLERKVAIKEFFPKNYCDRNYTTSQVTLGTQSSKEFVDKLKVKFLKEARNIAKLNNPGIIKIHAAFEQNNTAYYVMDYIEGTSLLELIRKNGPLTEKQALGYIEKVGEALQYVHSLRMNHLDIKPSNIMIQRSNNQPILIDFGSSKQYDSEGHQTSTTPVGISHGYAPMEQYLVGGVKDFSPQTDLYSLAATLYFILSEVVPPQAMELVEDDLTFPQSIPSHLIGPISKAMANKRADRHESVKAFIDDLKNKQKKPDTETDTEIVNKSEANSGSGNNSKGKRESKPESEYELIENPVSKPASYKWLWSICVAAVIILAIVVWSTSHNDSSKEDEKEEVVQKTVENMEWDSPLGAAVYSGDVEPDTLVDSKKMIPHGKGKAEITAGSYAGNTYEGDFEYGTFQGQATYNLNNGDTFIGTFYNNKYEKGKYILNTTGEYFEGTFKDGSPDYGSWYDKNGNKL